MKDVEELHARITKEITDQRGQEMADLAARNRSHRPLCGASLAPDPAPENHDRTTGHQNVITVSASIFEAASSAIDARCTPRAFPGGWRESSSVPLRNA